MAAPMTAGVLRSALAGGDGPDRPRFDHQ